MVPLDDLQEISGVRWYFALDAASAARSNTGCWDDWGVAGETSDDPGVQGQPGDRLRRCRFADRQHRAHSHRLAHTGASCAGVEYTAKPEDEDGDATALARVRPTPSFIPAADSSPPACLDPDNPGHPAQTGPPD